MLGFDLGCCGRLENEPVDARFSVPPVPCLSNKFQKEKKVWKTENGQELGSSPRTNCSAGPLLQAMGVPRLLVSLSSGQAWACFPVGKVHTFLTGGLGLQVLRRHLMWEDEGPNGWVQLGPSCALYRTTKSFGPSSQSKPWVTLSAIHTCSNPPPTVTWALALL